MSKGFIVFILLFGQLCFGCESITDNSIKLKLESVGKTIICAKGDGDGDGVEDVLALIGAGDAMSFVAVLSSFGGKVLRSKSMSADGCQGSCGVEDVYFKKGSMFIQRDEKNYTFASSKTYQFKLYGSKLKLIGVKLKSFSSHEENEIEELTDDVNWGNGKRIITTKYANGKITSENRKMETYEVLFEDFDLSMAQLN